MVPRPAAVEAAPSPDGRVFSGLASSGLAFEAFVALRSSACGLAHSSVGCSSHLVKSSFKKEKNVTNTPAVSSTLSG